MEYHRQRVRHLTAITKVCTSAHDFHIVSLARLTLARNDMGNVTIRRFLVFTFVPIT
jgi:hypothetical protein